MILNGTTYTNRAFITLTYYNTYRQLNREKDINLLETHLSGAHTNRRSYDKMNYEELLWLEAMYKEDEEVSQLIQQVKDYIVEGYIQKQQLLTKVLDVNHVNDGEEFLDVKNKVINNSRLKTYFITEQQGESKLVQDYVYQKK